MPTVIVDGIYITSTRECYVRRNTTLCIKKHEVSSHGNCWLRPVVMSVIRPVACFVWTYLIIFFLRLDYAIKKFNKVHITHFFNC